MLVKNLSLLDEKFRRLKLFVQSYCFLFGLFAGGIQNFHICNQLNSIQKLFKE